MNQPDAITTLQIAYDYWYYAYHMSQEDVVNLRKLISDLNRIEVRISKERSAK